MKLSQPVDDRSICLSDPLCLPDIVQPSGRIVALRPDFGFGQVAQQVPVARPIAAPYPTALCHQSQELTDILLTDPVLDRDHYRAAAGQIGRASCRERV